MTYKITAYLLDGRIATDLAYLPLDGFLYSAYVKEYKPELIGKPFETEPEDFPLPIERIEKDGQWYYDCSFALFKILGEDSTNYNKRYDATFAEKHADLGRSKVVTTRKGKYKNVRNILNIYLTNKISWYVNGDIKEIMKLLKHINYIGKKRSQGFGRIKKWEYEEVEENLCNLRPIPNKNGNDFMSVRPPYFHQKNKCRCDLYLDERLGYTQVFL